MGEMVGTAGKNVESSGDSSPTTIRHTRVEHILTFNSLLHRRASDVSEGCSRVLLAVRLSTDPLLHYLPVAPHQSASRTYTAPMHVLILYE